jgi:hypothetical protein
MRRQFRCAKGLILLVLPVIAFGAGGNIAITGHDSDFHASGCGFASPARSQIIAMIAFARAGAPTPGNPVLSFDHGAELTSCLTALGIPFTNIDPDVGVPAAANFNVATYSAIVVASDSSCGGCDNTSTSIANLVAAGPAIGAFLDAGGGIVAFAGAGNASTYYGFLPATASGFGSPPSIGYVQTAFGVSVGIPAVNGDPTHNFFNTPGTAGVAAAYGVVEALGAGGTAETIACAGCTTGTLSGTPPPAATGAPALGIPALLLTAMLLAGMAYYLQRRAAVR